MIKDTTCNPQVQAESKEPEKVLWLPLS